MKNLIKALINFDSFCLGCKCYSDLLVAMGLAPVLQVGLTTFQNSFITSVSPAPLELGGGEISYAD